jgi:hypothetical protein
MAHFEYNYSTLVRRIYNCIFLVPIKSENWYIMWLTDWQDVYLCASWTDMVPITILFWFILYTRWLAQFSCLLTVKLFSKQNCETGHPVFIYRCLATDSFPGDYVGIILECEASLHITVLCVCLCDMYMLL